MQKINIQCFILLICLLNISGSCTQLRSSPESDDQIIPSNRVIIFMIDGLGTDYLALSDMPEATFFTGNKDLVRWLY
ncbi:MAG: hypothetical protein MI921_30355 [Cytophagales bacterium]|nr:hypothetical protein [Cytophagales bacterium]